ncbi:MAG: NADH-quinone oxidoreductase subunit M [Phycisphaeraceae bacterium]|nr:NADH-quinone oxidoreductase subunit M [Phycisphaeraceae bacterium]
MSLLLNFMIFLPAIGGLLCLAAPGGRQARSLAFWVTVVTLAMSLMLVAAFDYSAAGPQFETAVPWISAINVEYRTGVDGLSLSLVVLTTGLALLGLLASWNIEKSPKVYFSLYLFLLTGMLGVFLALDLFLFYVFFEISLVPMYFLIGIWGGPRREYAAIKFFLFTLAGSICLLIVMLGLYLVTPQAVGKNTWVMVASSTSSDRGSEAVPATLVDERVRRMFAGPRFDLERWNEAAGDESGRELIDALRLDDRSESTEAVKAVLAEQLRLRGEAGLGQWLAEFTQAVLIEGRKPLALPVEVGEANLDDRYWSVLLVDQARGGRYWVFAQWAFWLSLIAFLIKLPSVPFHTWLPDAHVEAPTPISMILAGVLLKMGGYAMMRITWPYFPDAAIVFWHLVAGLGVLAILYGAFCAMAQTDWKKLVAYSSVSHMGYVTLGIAVMTASGWNGAYFQMIGHGVSSAMMFFLVGVIYERSHHRDLDRLGGLWTRFPAFGGWSMVGFFAAMGLPGLCGFIGEILVLLGTFDAASPGAIGAGSVGLVYVYGALAACGVILTAGYILWMFQRVYMGRPREEYHDYAPISRREYLIMGVLGVAAIVLGIVPMLVFVMTRATFAGMLASMGVG